MYYFIKSHKWTKNDGVETWWKADSRGYSRFICKAGVYIDDDKLRMEPSFNKNDSEFIPVTEDLIQKGLEQLQKNINSCNELIVKEELNYKRYKESMENEINKYQIEYENFQDFKTRYISGLTDEV